MDYKEYFKSNYPGINPLDYIKGYDILYNLRIKAFDTDGKVEDIEACREFSKMCNELYKQLESYKEQIESDIAEYNGENGYSLFCDMPQEGCDALVAMKEICELYHRFYGSILLYAKESVDGIAQTDNAPCNMQNKSNNTIGSGNSRSSSVNNEAHNDTENFKIPDDFFNEKTDNYDNYTCPAHRKLKDKYIAAGPMKLTRLICWLAYTAKYIEGKTEVMNCFLLAISGRCPDKNLKFRPIKLESNKVANNISVLIQILCEAPLYSTLNQLFNIENYNWQSLDVKHNKKMRKKIEEIYKKRE